MRCYTIRRPTPNTCRCSTSPQAKASFEIHNSPLSEYACVGFEYGYAAAVPKALVLWEAQFGDFVNGAQIIIDQFIAAGQAKWGQTSRLTLLLAARLRRARAGTFERAPRTLLAALGRRQHSRRQSSTAAQYFHLLRQQARRRIRFPLVIMTPKSLLRVGSGVGHDRRHGERCVPTRHRRSERHR